MKPRFFTVLTRFINSVGAQKKLKLLLLFLLLLPCTALAEGSDSVATPAKKNRHSLVRRTVRGFDRLDTTFIEPQHYIYTVMLQATHTYDIFTLSSRGRRNDTQSITFAPDMRLKLGPYVGWKWFFAGYTFELGNIDLGRIKTQVDLSIYSSQVGLDLYYRRTGSDYKLRDARLGKGIAATPLEDVPFDGIKAGITGLSIYYIFNHGRFSYPAAFSQSTIQKVSCGSWMAGLGYTKNSLDVDYESLQQTIDSRLGNATVALDSGMMISNVAYHDFNVSAGYAYNWVPAKGWLIAVSGQMALAYKRSTGEAASTQAFQFDNINVNAGGRFGAVYNTMRWYAGASIILRSNNYRKSRFSTNNTFGSMNLYVGYNFGLKKKYRKNK